MFRIDKEITTKPKVKSILDTKRYLAHLSEEKGKQLLIFLQSDIGIYKNKHYSLDNVLFFSLSMSLHMIIFQIQRIHKICFKIML